MGESARPKALEMYAAFAQRISVSVSVHVHVSVSMSAASSLQIFNMQRILGALLTCLRDEKNRF